MNNQLASGDVKLVMDGTTYYLSTTATAAAEAKSATTSTLKTKETTAEPYGIGGPPRGFAATLPQYITFILTAIMVIAILLVLFQLVSAGIEWITSGGEKGKTEGAKQKIIAAVVGIIILSSAYALAQFIVYILGLGTLDTILQQVPQLPQ